MIKKNRQLDKGMQYIEQRIKFAFLTVKEELNEHLESINENTDEIQANSDHTYELESKISKLAEKIEHIELTLERLSKPEHLKIELSEIEKKLFLVLYTVGEGVLLSIKKISERLDISEKSAGALIASFSDKGIPVIKRIVDDRPFFELEKEFKDMQAKERLIEISPDMYQEFN